MLYLLCFLNAVACGYFAREVHKERKRRKTAEALNKMQRTAYYEMVNSYETHLKRVVGRN